MRVDIWSRLSVDTDMINLDEFDPRKARSGLFALVTARLEDAHELAVQGQNREITNFEASKLLIDLADHTNQIEILMTAIGAIRE